MAESGGAEAFAAAERPPTPTSSGGGGGAPGSRSSISRSTQLCVVCKFDKHSLHLLIPVINKNVEEHQAQD